MLHNLLRNVITAVEILFFTGLVGCVLVVLISWVSVFKGGFTDKDQ